MINLWSDTFPELGQHQGEESVIFENPLFRDSYSNQSQVTSFLAEHLGYGVTFVSYSTLCGKEQGSKCRKERERKQRQATYCSDGLKLPQQFTDATRISVSMKNASKLQVTAKMAKQQTSHQSGEQKNL